VEPSTPGIACVSASRSRISSAGRGANRERRFLQASPELVDEFITERCIEIAKECLTGGVHRRVPDLDVEASNLFQAFEGSDPISPAEVCRRNQLPRTALQVAAFALQTAALIRR
jgi:hypothetical protein